MPLTQAQAVRILRFCLGPDDSGSAGVMADGACVVSLVLSRSVVAPHSFEGATFDEALRCAATAGTLKHECIEKQIRFLARRDDAGAGIESEAALAATDAVDVETPPGSAALDEGSSFLKLVEAIHALLHETQHERGISTLYTASGGLLMADKLSAQWRRTDHQRAALTEVRRFLDRSPAAVVRRLDRATALLDHLAGTRAALEDQTTSAPRIIEGYSTINSELLAALDAYLLSDGFGPQRSGALACLSLLYAKEKTGIERAQLAHVFLTDRFSEGQRVAAATAIAGKTTYLHIFSAAAPRAAEQLLRRILASPAAADVARMEKVVFSSSEAGFGIDASRWFEAISRTIDLLGDVSNKVIAILRERH
jgi:hypothetical protein